MPTTLPNECQPSCPGSLKLPSCGRSRCQTRRSVTGTVQTSLPPSPGQTPPGGRASLADAGMDLPEVQASSRLEATVPLGDAESLRRLRERIQETVTRPAGSTALVGCGHAGRRPAGPRRPPIRLVIAAW